MYEKELKVLKRNIKILIGLRRITNKSKIYVFGVNDPSHHIIRELELNGINVENVIDNDEKKHNMYCCGKKIIPVDDIAYLDENDKKRSCFLIRSFFYKEMKRQLLNMNIPNKNIFIIKVVSSVRETFLYRWYMKLSGEKIYNNIVKKYGSDHKIFLCPYTGTGDIYLIGTFLRQYLNKNNIDKYVLIVVSKACQKVTRLFNLENVELLSDTDKCSDLIIYYMVEPDKCKMQVLNDSWGEIYTNPTQWIRGYKGHNFTDMFRKYVFNLPEAAYPEPPLLEDRSEDIIPIFEKYGLQPHKTIILSPYATTLADIPNIFWEKLALKLKEMRYYVCTNSSGEKEPPVKGTEAVFFPLDIAPQTIEYAGGFIGIRSGFCDVISAAKAKKIILYDHNNWFYNCSAFEYFSLNNMKLCDDAYEFELNMDNTDKVFNDIIDLFK